MPGDKRLIRSIKLKNFLSFGPETPEIELRSLNVVIGPNASGKSNLIEALGFLRSTPKDLAVPIRNGGGVSEWLWKGTGETPVAEIDVALSHPGASEPLVHRIKFSMVGQRFELIDELVRDAPSEHYHSSKPDFCYHYLRGEAAISVYHPENRGSDRSLWTIRHGDNINHNLSVLAQRQGPEYPEITYLATHYSQIKLYREMAMPRLPQKTDLPGDFLAEDAGNLALVLNHLQQNKEFQNILIERLRQFHDSFSDVSTKIDGGTVQIFLHEDGLQQAVPATRLSDGTLRFLCLLSVLCHPTPPPLICIEEPEIGLHPDILPMVAELLVEASHRTQLIVTTHSDILVDALTSTPEAVLVCEKQAGATVLKRLDADELKPWLEKYRLGELWIRGDLGGVRW